MTRRLLPLALLFLLLLALLPLKARFEFGLGPRAHDADYYYDIARHVADGHGLRSNLSLYFQGFQSFPHRVTQSPVWPLALGAAGGVLGIDAVATRLPNLLYFVDLILLYFLALRLQARIAGTRPGLLFRPGWPLNFGHVAVLLFATNIRFFRFTSVPNNEALAFLWIFSALLALDRAAERNDLRWSALAGLLGALALLTRVQALAAIGVVPVVLCAVSRDGRRSIALAAAALAGAVLAMIPWALYLASWTDALTLNALLGMETQYETPKLGVLSHTRSTPGLWPTLLDRFEGLRIAFDPNNSQSYVHHFNAAVYLLPLAALQLAWVLLRRPLPRRLELAPRHALVVATLGMGLGMLLPVHMSHMAFSKEWLFGFRHGLPLLFLILPALAYLDAHAARALQIATAAVLALSLAMNAVDMKKLFETKFRTGLLPHEAQLVQWFDTQVPLPKVVTTRPWELGTYSRSGYHWILCNSDPAQTLRLLRDAGADYVVLFEADRGCPFAAGLFPQHLRIVRVFGDRKLWVLEPHTRATGR